MEAPALDEMSSVKGLTARGETKLAAVATDGGPDGLS